AIGDGAFALSHSYRLLFDAVPVLALAAFHATAPAMRPRPWLLALPVGVGITFAVFFLFLYSGMPGSGPALQTALDWPGLWCVGLAAAGLAHLAAASTGRSPAPSWTLALAGLAALVLGLRLTTLVDHLAFTAATPERTTSAIIAGAQAAAALGTGLALAVVAARRVRRTPTAPGSPTPADTGAAR
ncbi:MAG TPA: hypothetical protein VES42_20015, partial [Pilimelia sp.]|nr:hypothetical protein [Pilimelia sp.]